MRRQVTYVVGIIAISVAGLVYTFASGNEPLLGLDLQGGASVVLEPEPLPDGQEITEETLDQAVDIIRNRVDGLGVREPEVTRQGETILVQIPGVEDQQRAIDLVGQTAELRFRPVLEQATLDDEAAFNAATAAIAAGDLDVGGGDQVDVVLAHRLAEVLRNRITECLLAGGADADAGLEHPAGHLAVAEAGELHGSTEPGYPFLVCVLELLRGELDVEVPERRALFGVVDFQVFVSP